ncbi:MAG: four helix bundle protein, partial [Candidatus Moraniibacteriota bacterium]
RNFFSIALKSANETHFWFCLLRDSKKVEKSAVAWFIQESDEICKMLGKTVVSLKKEGK